MSPQRAERARNVPPEHVKYRVYDSDRELVTVRAVTAEVLYRGTRRNVIEDPLGVRIITRREWTLKDPQDFTPGHDMEEDPANWIDVEAAAIFYPWHMVRSIETSYAFEPVRWD